jgi:hypothetical protein
MGQTQSNILLELQVENLELKIREKEYIKEKEFINTIKTELLLEKKLLEYERLKLKIEKEIFKNQTNNTLNE